MKHLTIFNQIQQILYSVGYLVNQAFSVINAPLSFPLPNVRNCKACLKEYANVVATIARDSSHADTILAFNENRGIQEVSSSLVNLPANLKFDPKAFNTWPIHDGTRPSLELREEVYPYVDNTAKDMRADLEAEKTCVVSLITHLACLGTLSVSIATITAGIAALSVKISREHHLDKAR